MLADCIHFYSYINKEKTHTDQIMLDALKTQLKEFHCSHMELKEEVPLGLRNIILNILDLRMHT